MRILIEPDKLRRFMAQALVARNNKAELEKVTFVLRPQGVTLQDTSMGALYLMGIWKKSFFVEYDPGKDEKLTMAESMIEGIKKGFEDKLVEVYTEGTGLWFKGKLDKYHEDLVAGEPPVKFIDMISDDKRGLIPRKLDAKVSGLLDMSNFQLPDAENYAFKAEKSVLTISMKVSKGMKDRIIQFKETEKVEDIEAKFRADYLLPILNNLEGDVWFALTKDAVVFAKKNVDNILTYILMSIGAE